MPQAEQQLVCKEFETITSMSNKNQEIAMGQAEQSTPTARLAAAGYHLPSAASPAFDYVAVTQFGQVLYVAGQLPKEDGEVRIVGRCGEDIDLEQARFAAEVCTLQGLACAAEAAGGLDEIAGVLRVTGFVASTPDFHDQPKVLDASSRLLREVFGEAGRHARSAIGVAALPRRAPVEIEFIFTTRS
jgi:enamine deaminase RidA (YjgF/YER057c/UK114 family)